MKKLIVTGSGGLIGSEVAKYFIEIGWQVIGIDNNMRSKLFGPLGDIKWNVERLERQYSNYKTFSIDIRNRNEINNFIIHSKPDALVHCAAQPSHDLAAERVFDDFEINALGTLNLLESIKNYNANIPFVFLSTNKVYGDAPNQIKLIE